MSEVTNAPDAPATPQVVPLVAWLGSQVPAPSQVSGSQASTPSS